MLVLWTTGVYRRAFREGEKGVDVCYALVPLFQGISYPVPGPHGLCAKCPGCSLVSVPWAAGFYMRASRVQGGERLLCFVCESRFSEYRQGWGN